MDLLRSRRLRRKTRDLRLPNLALYAQLSSYPAPVASARQLSWRRSDAMSEQIHSSAIRPSLTR